MIRAGTYDQRVTLQRRVSGSDAAGQPNTHWEPLVTVWASIRTMGGLEAIKSGAVTSIVQASIRIFWRDGITSAMRVVHGTTVYEIKAALPDARREYIDLVCEAAS